MTLPEIRNIQEPRKLVLAWIPSLANGPEHRTWRRVAELTRGPGDEPVTLTYLVGTPDYEEAVKRGFTGHPAFPAKQHVHKINVLESFLKRLPPRTRRDFPEYLEMFRLPADAQISDFALLGYTEARLPSDDFAILLPLEDFTTPFEVVTQVSGVRHEVEVDLGKIQVGDTVTLQATPHPKDPHAVNVVWQGHKLGHLPRLHAETLGRLAREGRIHATIVRVNGSAERPVVRLFLAAK